MEFYDIEQLTKKGYYLYDLTKLTFNNTFEGIKFGEYIVQRGEEMRIDLVSKSIYKTTIYSDIILNINCISLALNVKEGTTLIYPEVSYIELFRIQNSESNIDEIKLNNTSKAVKEDSNRQKYVSDNYSLPPTMLNSPVEQVKSGTNEIKVGEGLFNK